MTKKSKKKKAQPKRTIEELETMTSDELMREILGPEGQEVLKHEVLTHEERPKNDYRFPT